MIYFICCCLLTQLCPTLCNPMDCVVHQALFKGFSRKEYWSGLPFPSPEDILSQGYNPHLLQLVHYRQILYHWVTGETWFLLHM